VAALRERNSLAFAGKNKVAILDVKLKAAVQYSEATESQHPVEA